MDLYSALPPSKSGAVVLPPPVRAPKPIMAPAFLARRKPAVTTKPAVPAPHTESVVHGGHSRLGQTRHAGTEVSVVSAASSSEIPSTAPQEDTQIEEGAAETFLFPECEDEYDPWRPNSLESILRDREAVRLARIRQLEDEEREAELEMERSRQSNTSPTAPGASDYGRGRGMNNLPAWMKGAAAGAVAGATTLAAQDGSAFVGGGDNAGLGLSSDALNETLSPAAISGSVAGPGAPPAPAAPPKSKALKMMAAWGYEVGKGLGKDGTGITSALEHVKTGARSGVIVSRGAPTGHGTTLAGVGPTGSASRVVLLCNMAAPGSVDDDLASEVQEECGERYGPVRQCFVFECAASLGLPPEEAVRTFVMFEDAASAERARSQLDGRFFGGRKIAASLYAEDRFNKLDLAPDVYQ